MIIYLQILRLGLCHLLQKVLVFLADALLVLPCLGWGKLMVKTKWTEMIHSSIKSKSTFKALFAKFCVLLAVQWTSKSQ